MGQHPGIFKLLYKNYNLFFRKKGWVNITGMVGQHKSERWVNMVRNLQFAFTAGATKNRINYTLPIANAGADQTIYLTQTSSITLDGSASVGNTYLWTDISTDYKSGAVITSPTSLITKVTGLTQGTWYYEFSSIIWTNYCERYCGYKSKL